METGLVYILRYQVLYVIGEGTKHADVVHGIRAKGDLVLAPVYGISSNTKRQFEQI